MTRPDDALFRLRLGALTFLRYFIPFLILTLLFAAPVVLLGPGWLWLSWLLFFAGCFVLWSLRGLTRYPEHTVGIDHRVDEDTFDGPRKHCTECNKTTTQGLRRRYARQAVLFGIPIHTLEWGINDYCLKCAQPGGGPGVDPHDHHGRVENQDESAARELERAFEN